MTIQRFKDFKIDRKICNFVSNNLLIAIALCSLLTTHLYSQVDTGWVRIYNGPGNAADEARAIAVDGQGNVYITGISQNANQDNDYVTIKYNSAGIEQWVRRYNGPGNDDDEANALAIDSQGNVYVTGFSYDSITSLDIATIKYNANGDTVWIRRYSLPTSNFDGSNAIAVDGQGNVYVTGESYSSETYYDYLTIKYYANGDTAWIKRYNGSGNWYDYAYAIAVDTQGYVYVTGLSSGSGGSSFDYATIKYNANGDTVWLRRYNGPGDDDDWAHSIAVDGQGNVYVTGESRDSVNLADYATIKYNSSGDTLWLRRYNGPGNNADVAYSLAVDGQGNVYVTGESPVSGSNYDYATIKYNATGTQEWVQRYNGPGNSIDKACALALDAQGNAYVTGGSRGAGFVEDYATIKYNSSGVEQWVRRYNGPGNVRDKAYALTIDSQANVYVTGSSGNSNYDGDYATIKYNSNGDSIWIHRFNGPGNSTDIASAIAVDYAGNVYATGASLSSGTANNYATIKYVQTGAIQENREPLSTDRLTPEIYPNPAKSFLAIRLPYSADQQNLKIFDVMGNLVKIFDCPSAQEHRKEVRVSLKGINPGIYFVELGKELVTKKLVITK